MIQKIIKMTETLAPWYSSLIKVAVMQSSQVQVRYLSFYLEYHIGESKTSDIHLDNKYHL